jgi:hypothetical protein
VFVQVLLTLAIYCLLSLSRFRAIAAAGRPQGKGDVAMGRYPWPDDAVKLANNQRNQFELPVLFYAAAAFALILGAADTAMVALAWAFVASRVVHAAIHIGPNRIRWRGPVFALGFLIVTAMWGKLFLHVLMSST